MFEVNFEVDDNLVKGLDYYSDVVFEILLIPKMVRLWWIGAWKI